MKKILLILVFLSNSLIGFAQVFETGLSLYDAGDYTRAARVFEQLDEPRGYLFSAKSYFNLGESRKALHFLDKVPSNSDADIYQDALHTKALAYFELKNFSSSLDALYQLSQSTSRTNIVFEGQRLYAQILAYLSTGQRYQAFRTTDYQKVRFDLIEGAIGIVDYSTLKTLLEYYKRTELNPQLYPTDRLDSQLVDSVSYSLSFNPRYPQAPEGTIYNLGVALPQFASNGQTFEVSQGLYFGVLLAVEEYNSNTPDRKVFVNYKDTKSDPSIVRDVMTDLVWNNNVDAVIGPLFSESAEAYAKISEEFEVPLIAPLANSDSINVDNNYAFQFNPSFEAQGRRLAEYAVNTLGYDTLAILAESSALGAASASGFRYRAEELGAHISYYFVQDLEELGYDITDYTGYFTSDTLLIDSLKYTPTDAIYAPFTGDAAPTLIESLLTDLEAMRSEVHILGSEEWSTVDLESRRLNDTELTYSLSFDVTTDSLVIDNFRSSYRLRFNREPNQFSYIGYDVANTILEVLQQVGNPVYLKDALRDYKSNRALSIGIDFKGTHINQAVKVERFRRRLSATNSDGF